MGATTTQGTGPGSVPVKKSDHLSLGVNRLVGPKIIYAGILVLEGESGVVYIPEQAGKVCDYCVFVSNSSSVHAFLSSPLTDVAARSQWRFGVTAGNNDIVNYIVVKI